MKYASYSRTSTNRQKDQCTIGMQLDAQAQYAQIHKITIVERYIDDGITSRIPLEVRPDGSRLLQDAAHRRFDTLLVFKRDRLARRAQDQLNVLDTIQSLGVKVLSITEPALNDTVSPAGIFMGTIIAGAGQFEKDTFRERSMAGHYAKSRLGQWQGGRAPFGYKIVDNKLQIHDEQAEVVREIFALYISGSPSAKIAEILNERQIPNPLVWMGRNKGHGWHAATITNLLRRPTYQGIATWRRTRAVEHKGQQIGRIATSESERVHFEVPAIVTPETWQRAREECARHNHFAPKGKCRLYELGGLIKCGSCGKAYIGGKVPRGYKIHYYYDCSGKVSGKGNPDRCANKMVRGLELEERVWAEIVNYSKNPEEWEQEARKHAEAETLHLATAVDAVKGLEKKIKDCVEGRARIINLSRRGAIREDEAVGELNKIQTEQEGLEQTKAKYQAGQLEEKRLEERIQEGLELLHFVDPNADASTRTDKFRKLIKQIVINTVEENGKRRVEATVEFGIVQILPGEKTLGCSSIRTPILFNRHFGLEDNRKNNGRPKKG